MRRTTNRRYQRQIENETSGPDAGIAPGKLRPLPFRSSQVEVFKLRLVASGAIALQTFNAQDILRILTFTTSSTQGYAFASSIRLSYVEMWEPMQSPPSTTSLAGIRFYGTSGTNTGTNDERFCVSAAPDYPSHLVGRPPKGTLQSFWQNTSSSLVMFDLLNIDQGTIIDICFRYYNGVNQSAVNLGPYAITASGAGITGVHLPNVLLSGVGLNNV